MLSRLLLLLSISVTASHAEAAVLAASAACSLAARKAL
jgi:hypothetical protein